MVQSCKFNLYVVGTLIYRKQWAKRALNLILKDLELSTSVQDIARATKGQFCLIISNGKDIYIITDRLASFPIFRIQNPSFTQISNILPCLLKHNKVTINPQRIAEYISLGYCFDGSFLNEIHWLKMATIYRFGEKSSADPYDNTLANIQFDKYRHLSEVSNILTEITLDNLSFLDSQDEIFIDLTGGFDTRTIATLMNHKKYRYTTGICPDPIIHISSKLSPEVRIAREVSNALKVKHHDDFLINTYDCFQKTLNAQLMITSGVPIPYANIDYINYFRRIKKDYSIHIAGYVGTQLLSQEMRKLSYFRSKFDIQLQIRKRYHYLDIFHGNFITQKRYEEATKIKFQNWLQEIGTDHFEHAAAYLSLFGYSKGWHGTSMNTETCILPVYAPFYESDCVRLLLETAFSIKKRHQIQKKIIADLNPEVGLIMTTHGYNAHEKSTNFRQALKTIGKDLSRPIIYQSKFLTRFRRFLERYLDPAMSNAKNENAFWVNAVLQRYSIDMKIFSFVDPRKLERQISQMVQRRRQILLARLVYINGLMEKYNIQIPHS
jgi:hypothetical protein